MLCRRCLGVWVVFLCLLAGGFRVQAVESAVVNQDGEMSTVSAFPASWKWRLFADPSIPEGLFAGGETVQGDVLPLPDGRVLQAKTLHFPADGILNVRPLLGFEPAVLTRSVLVADFDAAEAGRAVLGLGVDWEFELYLNGKKITSTHRVGNSEILIKPDNHLIPFEYQKGRNQMILEAYNGDTAFIVAAKLLQMPALALKYEPWTVFPDGETGAVTVVFTLNRKAPAGVDFRRKGTSSWTRVYDNLGGQIRRDRDVHAIRLEGLDPDAGYEYRVVLLDLSVPYREEVLDRIYSFRTAPQQGRDFSFAVTADLQCSKKERTGFLQTLFQSPVGKEADFFAFLGDVEWTSDFDVNVVEGMIEPFLAASDRRKMLVTVRGNHEMYGQDVNRFFDYFNAPFPGREGYTMFRWGDVCFIQLDFGDDEGRCPCPSTRWLHDMEPYIQREAAWLKRAVELPVCRDAKYRVVLAHGIAVGDPLTYMPGHIKKVIDPVFAGENPVCRVHLYLGGHVHYPLRSLPGQNAWRCRHDLKKLLPDHPVRERDGEKYRFTVVSVSGPRRENPPELQMSGIQVQVTALGLEVTSFDRNMKVFDRFRIDADGHVEELFSADWFSLYQYGPR